MVAFFPLPNVSHFPQERAPPMIEERRAEQFGQNCPKGVGGGRGRGGRRAAQKEEEGGAEETEEGGGGIEERVGKGRKGKEGEGRLFTSIVATAIALQSWSQQPPPTSPTPHNPGGPCKGME